MCGLLADSSEAGTVAVYGVCVQPFGAIERIGHQNGGKWHVFLGLGKRG